MSDILDRDALYYPYIHITDVDWLKATLLSFPQVRRIVPRGFDLNDSSEIQLFRSREGARRPLLAEEPAELEGAYLAQQRLKERLEKTDPQQLDGFTLKQLRTDPARNPDAFQMHVGKLEHLVDFLLNRDLAWPATAVSSSNRKEWIALHPRLGEVVMSLIAMAIADEKGLDIVTNSGRAHRALAQMDEVALVDSLFDGGSRPIARRGPRSEADDAELANELCQVVMLTQFDMSKLSHDAIVELQKDGHDLRRFKKGLREITASIPTIADPDERRRRLVAAAGEVADQWASYRKSLPKFAIDALLSASKWKPPEMLMAALGGATSVATLAAGSGLLIGIGIYTGIGIWHEYRAATSHPYQYLSRIQKATAAATVAPLPVAVPRSGGSSSWIS